MPRIHTVQTASGAPLARAWERVTARLRDELGWATGPVDPDAEPAASLLRDVAGHRSAYMWPWETEPHSVAHGILDDETYDWLAIVRGTLASGGSPVVVDEATLLEANDIARSTTGIDVDPTGSAGLAGLLELRRHGLVGSNETVAVIFTGVRREMPAVADPLGTHVGGER